MYSTSARVAYKGGDLLIPIWPGFTATQTGTQDQWIFAAELIDGVATPSPPFDPLVPLEVNTTYRVSGLLNVFVRTVAVATGSTPPVPTAINTPTVGFYLSYKAFTTSNNSTPVEGAPYWVPIMTFPDGSISNQLVAATNGLSYYAKINIPFNCLITTPLVGTYALSLGVYVYNFAAGTADVNNIASITCNDNANEMTNYIVTEILS